MPHQQLDKHEVFLGGVLLKPNMIISAREAKNQANINTVSQMTLKCLKENVPEEVPGIVFLSGGQSNELATAHLNEMNKVKDNYKWNLSFSYGRALQQPSLNNWQGKDNQIEKSQLALLHRSKLNSDATLGTYSSSEENL
jgi:fructose-bisphosphate aldolase class I